MKIVVGVIVKHIVGNYRGSMSWEIIVEACRGSHREACRGSSS